VVVVCRYVKGECGPGYYHAGNTSHPLEFSSADLRCLKCPSAGTKYSTLATVSGYWRAINNDTINTGSLSCSFSLYINELTPCTKNHSLSTNILFVYSVFLG
jgi:hypothetical protein